MLFDLEGLAEERHAVLAPDKLHVFAQAPGDLHHYSKSTATEMPQALGISVVLSETIGDLLQEQIAGPAPGRVIDQAQAGDIDDRHGKARACLGRVRDQPGKLLTEKRTLREAGMAVVVGQESDRRVLVQILQCKGEIPRYFAQHLQLFEDDYVGIARSEHQRANRATVTDERQEDQRAQLRRVQ